MLATATSLINGGLQFASGLMSKSESNTSGTTDSGNMVKGKTTNRQMTIFDFIIIGSMAFIIYKLARD